MVAFALGLEAAKAGTPEPAQQGVESNANAQAGAVSVSHAGAVSGSASNAIAGGGRSSAEIGDVGASASVGDVIAKGGEGGNSNQTQTATGGASNQTQTANNTGNQQDISINHEAVRQAPSIAQGAVMPSGCGVGGNAGGSQPGGAAFVGFSFTTEECYLLLYAAAYNAIGMPDTSCDLLNSSDTTQKAMKRLTKIEARRNGLAVARSLPDCTLAKNKPEPVDVPTVVVLEDRGPRIEGTPASKEYVNEVVKRAIVTGSGK